MKFSDNIIRHALDEVYVIRTNEEMEAREESQSNLWEYIRVANDGKREHLFKTVVRDLKIGESVYDNSGKYVAYRSE